MGNKLKIDGEEDLQLQLLEVTGDLALEQHALKIKGILSATVKIEVGDMPEQVKSREIGMLH